MASADAHWIATTTQAAQATTLDAQDREQVARVQADSWPPIGDAQALAQAQLSRQIGTPLSRNGRQRKTGWSIGCYRAVAVPLVGGWTPWWFLA